MKITGWLVEESSERRPRSAWKIAPVEFARQHWLNWECGREIRLAISCGIVYKKLCGSRHK